VPFAVAWTGLSLGMGRAQARRDPGTPSEDPPDDTKESIP
jgi:hypothetical protein